MKLRLPRRREFAAGPGATEGAQVDLTRYQGLAAQNAVPRQTLDTQVALVAQYQGTIEADRAAVKSAEVNLQYCRILSPLDGRVGLRQVDQGNYVTPGDANGLVVITQLQPISVLFPVPEDNLQAISKRLQGEPFCPRTPMIAAAPARSPKACCRPSTARSIPHRNDQAAGAVRERTKVLYPNQFVNIRLLLDTHKDVTTMPTAGFSTECQARSSTSSTRTTQSLCQGRAGRDRRRPCGGQFGLVPGDRIVIDGADKLRDGAKINVRTETGAGTAPAGTTRRARTSRAARNGVRIATKTMNPSQPFILRPVATTLLMIAIVLSGMLAFRFLPVAACLKWIIRPSRSRPFIRAPVRTS